MSGMYHYPCWLPEWQHEAMIARRAETKTPFAEQIRQALTLYFYSGQSFEFPRTVTVTGQFQSGQVLTLRVK